MYGLGVRLQDMLMSDANLVAALKTWPVDICFMVRWPTAAIPMENPPTAAVSDRHRTCTEGRGSGPVQGGASDEHLLF